MGMDLKKFLAGGFTGVAISPLITPIEVFKCRAQVSKDRTMRYREEAKRIMSKDGPAGFF